MFRVSSWRLTAAGVFSTTHPTLCNPTPPVLVGQQQQEQQEDPVSEGRSGVPNSGDQEVTPWSVTATGPKGIDYDRVLTKFQSKPVTQELVAKLECLSKKIAAQEGREAVPLHPFLSRGLAFSHRDLENLLDACDSQLSGCETSTLPTSPPTVCANSGGAGVRKKQPFYLYTGRGPSATSMHLGHAVPFVLCKYLQDVFNCPLVIQVTDDEKFLFRDLTMPQMDKMTQANIKDIIAFGFDPAKTFIFRNTHYMGRMYPTVLEIQRLMTHNMVKNTFGFKPEDNVGKYAFAATQAAPCFASSFPTVLPTKSKNLKCLIPCAIDQDPFFILTRSLCDRLKRSKPALLHTRFLPALKGAKHKMSSSAEQNGVLLLNDNKKTVEKKIKSAFSGGCGTLEDLKEKGADIDVDIAYQYLRFFCADTARVDALGVDYAKGDVFTGEVKSECCEVVWSILEKWQARRREVTDHDVAKFCEERNILF